MKTLIAKCQHCGAQLKTPDEAESVQCPYCKTLNQIKRARSPGPGPTTQVSPRAATKLIIFALLGAGAVLVPVVLTLVAPGSISSTLPSVSMLPSSTSWEGVHGAILTDLTGDGSPELIGRLRDVSADEITLGAFDGTSGERLWESDALGTYSDTYQGSLAFAEGLLVFAGPTGQLQAFAASDGEPRFRASLADRATGFCQEQPGQLRVDLADGSATRFLLTDGSLAPAPSAPSACARVATDSEDGDPSFTLSDDVDIDVEGMRANISLQREGGPMVVIGTRDKGTSVPMIAVVFGDPARTWKSDLAGTRPLETGPFAPDIGAVTADRAYTVYAFSDIMKPAMLVAFDLAGQRRWEAPLPTTMPITSVQATDARVFVAQWGTLQAYDAATGARDFVIGRR